MKKGLVVLISAALVFAYGRYQHQRGFDAGFAEGWQSYIDKKPPNPPPTKCRWRSSDFSKCIAWRKRT